MAEKYLYPAVADIAGLLVSLAAAMQLLWRYQ